MNACTFFPFKLTLPQCQHGAFQSTEIQGLYPHFNVIFSSVHIVSLMVGWFRVCCWWVFFLFCFCVGLFCFLEVAMLISKLPPKQTKKAALIRLGKPTNDAKATMGWQRLLRNTGFHHPSLQVQCLPLIQSTDSLSISYTVKRILTKYPPLHIDYNYPSLPFLPQSKSSVFS